MPDGNKTIREQTEWLWWRKLLACPPRRPAFPMAGGQQVGLAESLAALRDYACEYAEWSVVWYDIKRAWKKHVGRALRMMAILSASVASVIPILAEIYKQPDGVHALSPLWSTVALAVAGAMVALDRLLGSTSGWVRFMTAELELRTRLDEFRMEQEEYRLRLLCNELKCQEAQRIFNHIKAFLLKTHELVGGETAQWANEFRSAIRDMDAKVKDPAARETGRLVVNVTNGDQCEGGWSLFVDDQDEGKHEGPSFTVPNIASGPHTVRVVATIGGAEKRKEREVEIPGGDEGHVTLTLS
ncbi:MAG: SLATT domain-containing protein [Phycisphaerae bacterium]|nr:SLATT domain-containing protein [Phycisphaerae bacterium]